MENKEALMILNSIEHLQPVTLMQLLHRFGCATELFSQDRSLLATLVGPVLAEKITSAEKHFDLSQELRECTRRGIEWMDWEDTRYPYMLRQIAQPPPILYFRGRFDKKDQHALALVGSRQASRYGVGVARGLSTDLARTGFTIVSGLARGIDTAAHEGALEAGGRTLAVMGSGFAHPYPMENLPLMNRIAENGLVLSEFPLGRPPLPRNFPRRNRIISGLSLGIVVVEAARRSGSLITASHALEQGRSVFAVPGRLDSESSEGANALIQQGAKLVGSAKDIVEDLQYLLPERFLKGASKKAVPGQTSSLPLPDLNQAQQRILAAVETEPTGIDEIIASTKLPVPDVAGGLLVLEMQGLIQQYPGKNFARIHANK